ncbi:hypothetical protein DPEC_G00349840 [Dallia pectoralis]|uniref:Uncharacterized protein n=1 Tax=Dallia pectoralis TaxID=75939 RepID=A0ACC2F1H1_DALPE|nr:hypothetical protein DPEC_G00349840 [Dallia pectoralis]
MDRTSAPCAVAKYLAAMLPPLWLKWLSVPELFFLTSATEDALSQSFRLWNVWDMERCEAACLPGGKRTHRLRTPKLRLLATVGPRFHSPEVWSSSKALA